MITTITYLILALFSLYLSAVVLNLSDSQREMLSNYWKRIFLYMVVLLAALFSIALVRSMWLLGFLFLDSGGVVGVIEEYVFDLAAILMMIVEIAVLRDVFTVAGVEGLIPRVNLRSIIIVETFAIIWLYLRFLVEEYPRLLWAVSYAMQSVFVVSIILIAYTAYIVTKYVSLIESGGIIVLSDVTEFIFSISIAIAFFGFSRLIYSTECVEYVCGVFLAAFAIVMNHAVAMYGKSLKESAGVI
jgi:hypothetical protein